MEKAMIETKATRRDVMKAGLGLIAVVSAPNFTQSANAASAAASHTATKENLTMTDSFVTTQDGTRIFYKDWGPKDAQAIVFHHGWPLSADDWDNQMLFFLDKGYRVTPHDPP